MNYLAAELRGIRCHAGLDKPAPAISKPGASRIHYPIFPGFPFDFAQGGEPVEPRLLSASGGFAGMTTRRKRMGFLKK
jgi:hypothetical protein